MMLGYSSTDETTTTGRLDREYQSFLRAFGEEGSHRPTFPSDSRKRSLPSLDPQHVAGQKKSVFYKTGDNILESAVEDDSYFKIPKKLFRHDASDKQSPKDNREDSELTLVNDSCGASQIELINLKAEVASLETKIRRADCEYREAQILWDKKEAEFKQTNKTLENKIAHLTTELCQVREKEKGLCQELEESKKNSDVEKLRISAELSSVREDRRKSLDSYAELEVKSREEVERLREELLQERTRRGRVEEALEQKNSEVAYLRERNVQLTNEAREYQERVLDAEAKAREASQTLTQYEEDCKKALALRQEMLAFCEIKEKLKSVSEECRKYRLKSENTVLLREKNYELERKVERLTEAYEKAINENNELKIDLVDFSKAEESKSCLGKVDALVEELTKVKREKTELESMIQSLNENLQTESRKLEDTRNELSEKTDQFLKKLDEREDLVENLRREKEEALHFLELERAKVEELKFLKEDLVEKENLATSLASQIAQVREEKENAVQELRKKEEEFCAQTKSSASVEVTLRSEVSRLQQELQEKEELIEGLKERLHMKGDFDPTKTKVLHMEFNPLDEAHREYQQELETLRKEHGRVKIRVEELEKEKEKWMDEGRREELDLTTRVQYKVEVDKSKEEIENLKSQIKQLEKEKLRVNETHAQVGRQYREMCTLLTGYQCKMRDKEHYQVQSIYESGPEKSFLFKKSTDNELQLLESEYTPEWAGFVETYLETDGCIPAFLAAVTLQLYNQKEEKARSQEGRSSSPV